MIQTGNKMIQTINCGINEPLSGCKPFLNSLNLINKRVNKKSTVLAITVLSLPRTLLNLSKKQNKLKREEE